MNLYVKFCHFIWGVKIKGSEIRDFYPWGAKIKGSKNKGSENLRQYSLTSNAYIVIIIIIIIVAKNYSTKYRISIQREKLTKLIKT